MEYGIVSKQINIPKNMVCVKILTLIFFFLAWEKATPFSKFVVNTND